MGPTSLANTGMTLGLVRAGCIGQTIVRLLREASYYGMLTHGHIYFHLLTNRIRRMKIGVTAR